MNEWPYSQQSEGSVSNDN